MTSYRITIVCDSDLLPFQLEEVIETGERLSEVATGIMVMAQEVH